MRQFIISIMLIITFGFSKEVTETFKIEGMMCGMSCPSKVKEASNLINGIKSCEVSYEKSNAIITYDDELINSKSIAKKLAKETYYKVESSNKSKSFWEKLFGND